MPQVIGIRMGIIEMNIVQSVAEIILKPLKWDATNTIMIEFVKQYTVITGRDRPSQWEMANFDPSQNRNP